MRRRSPLRNALEYSVAIVALKSLQWTPRKLAFALARVYTRLLDLGIPRLRRVARRNLAMALPEFTPQRHAQLCLRSRHQPLVRRPATAGDHGAGGRMVGGHDGHLSGG